MAGGSEGECEGQAATEGRIRDEGELAGRRNVGLDGDSSGLSDGDKVSKRRKGERVGKAYVWAGEGRSGCWCEVAVGANGVLVDSSAERRQGEKKLAGGSNSHCA